VTVEEERRVSTCILARTNYFGTKVEISMRAEHKKFESLHAEDQEKDEFTIYEGDFFGKVISSKICLPGIRLPIPAQGNALRRKMTTLFLQRGYAQRWMKG